MNDIGVILIVGATQVHTMGALSRYTLMLFPLILHLFSFAFTPMRRSRFRIIYYIIALHWLEVTG